MTDGGVQFAIMAEGGEHVLFPPCFLIYLLTCFDAGITQAHRMSYFSLLLEISSSVSRLQTSEI